MPEQCLYCGELAVIEESVDGGGDQKICIECGSIATGKKLSAPHEFSDDEPDVKDNIATSDTSLAENETSLNEDTCLVCHSCGVSIDLEHPSKDQLCSECEAMQDDDESGDSDVNDEDCHTDGTICSLSKNETEAASVSKSKCTSCGSHNLNVDSVGGDERLICTDCGMVNSETILTADTITNEGYTSSKYHQPTLPHFAERERVRKGMTAGLTKISCLCSKFCFLPSLQTDAEDMYRRLFYHPKILHKSLVKKESIGAVCLFIICRQNELPVNMKHFLSDIPLYRHFLAAKKLVLAILNIQLPQLSITNLMIDVLQPLKFDKNLMDKVNDILFLLRRAWLTQGRDRGKLVTLAAYYAYVSSDKCKKFITRKQFCLKNKLPQVSQELALECEKFLFKLARSLPWVSQSSVTTRTLPMYINSILQYQDSLFHLVFKPVEDISISSTLMAQKCDPVGNSKRPVPFEKETLLPVASKKHKSIKGCFIEQKIVIPSDINLDSPILHESEFDEEISSYILSLEESERMREAKMSMF